MLRLPSFSTPSPAARHIHEQISILFLAPPFLSELPVISGGEQVVLSSKEDGIGDRYWVEYDEQNPLTHYSPKHVWRTRHGFSLPAWSAWQELIVKVTKTNISQPLFKIWMTTVYCKFFWDILFNLTGALKDLKVFEGQTCWDISQFPFSVQLYRFIRKVCVLHRDPDVTPQRRGNVANQGILWCGFGFWRITVYPKQGVPVSLEEWLTIWF